MLISEAFGVGMVVSTCTRLPCCTASWASPQRLCPVSAGCGRPCVWSDRVSPGPVWTGIPGVSLGVSLKLSCRVAPSLLLCAWGLVEKKPSPQSIIYSLECILRVLHTMVFKAPIHLLGLGVVTRQRMGCAGRLCSVHSGPPCSQHLLWSCDVSYTAVNITNLLTK